MASNENWYDKFAKVAVFTNISKKYFEHTHAFGDAPAIPYMFQPGESRTLPFIIASHLAKHLARKMLIDGAHGTVSPQSNRAIYGDEDVQKLMDQILGEVSEREVKAPKTLNERIAQEIEELNPTDKEIIAPEGEKVTTKQEIMALLDKKGVSYNARLSKAELQDQLEALS